MKTKIIENPIDRLRNALFMFKKGYVGLDVIGNILNDLAKDKYITDTKFQSLVHLWYTLKRDNTNV